MVVEFEVGMEFRIIRTGDCAVLRDLPYTGEGKSTERTEDQKNTVLKATRKPS